MENTSYKLVNDGTMVRFVMREVSALSDSQTMCRNVEKYIAQMVSPDSEKDQVLILEGLSHMYQQQEDQLNKIGHGPAYYCCLEIPLIISNADQWVVTPQLMSLGSQSMIFFAVTSFEDYMNQLKREAYKKGYKKLQEESAKKKQSKKQKIVKLDPPDE